jgi:hypothetical protein
LTEGDWKTLTGNGIGISCDGKSELLTQGGEKTLTGTGIDISCGANDDIGELLTG